MAEITLGSTVKDPITGLQGTAVARTTWLYGCVRILVQPNRVKDGTPADPTYVDEPQLEVVKPKRAKKVATPPAGGRDDGRIGRSEERSRA